MNTNINKINPIEMLRYKLGMTQKEFAEALHYTSVNNYAYHKNVFSGDIRKRIKDVYSVDLTSAIIAYLLAKIRSLQPARKSRKGNSPAGEKSGPSYFSKLLKPIIEEV